MSEPKAEYLHPFALFGSPLIIFEVIWYSEVFKSERVGEVIGDLAKTEDLALARGFQAC